MGIFGGLAQGFSQSFQSAQNFKRLAAQQAFQQNLQTQQQELQQERQGLERERVQFELGQAKEEVGRAKELRADIQDVIAGETELSQLGTTPSGAESPITKRQAFKRKKTDITSKKRSVLGRIDPKGTLAPKETKAVSSAEKINALKFEILNNPNAFPEELRNFAFGTKQSPDARAKAISAFGQFNRFLESKRQGDFLRSLGPGGEEFAPDPDPTFEEFVREATAGFAGGRVGGQKTTPAQVKAEDVPEPTKKFLIVE